MKRQHAIRRPGIRYRLALITAVAAGAVMLAFCIPLALFVRTVAYDRAIDAAELQARSLAAELAAVGNPAAIGASPGGPTAPRPAGPPSIWPTASSRRARPPGEGHSAAGPGWPPGDHRRSRRRPRGLGTRPRHGAAQAVMVQCRPARWPGEWPGHGCCCSAAERCSC